MLSTRRTRILLSAYSNLGASLISEILFCSIDLLDQFRIPFPLALKIVIVLGLDPQLPAAKRSTLPKNAPDAPRHLRPLLHLTKGPLNE